MAGRFPSKRHDHDNFDPDDPRVHTAGQKLEARGCLVQIKGDLVEQSLTFGLRGLASQVKPCFFCSAAADCLHHYAGVGVLDDIWGSDSAESYERACQQCEVLLLIDSEDTKRKVAAAHKQSQLVYWRTLAWQSEYFGHVCFQRCLGEQMEHV